MGFFAKRTRTGYKEIAGGFTDPEAAYYIQTKREHRENQEKLQQLEMKYDRATENIKNTVQILDAQREELNKNHKKELNQHIKKTKTVIEEKDKKISELEFKLKEIQI